MYLKRKTVAISALLHMLVCCFHASYAATTYAVVVGISNYQKFQPSNGDLRYASRDAQLFYNYLTKATNELVPRENVILLTDEMATKGNMLAAMEIFSKALPEDRVIFYFSGHGNSGVFLPYESSGYKPVLTHKEVKQRFRESRSELKLCIADACKSGTIEIQNFPASEGIHQASNANVIVFLSSLANQLSAEYVKLGQGVFTFYLLKALNGEADVNEDKQISALELYKYVSLKVRAYSRKNSPELPEQIPTMYGKFPKELPIAIL
ncbi:caspase family protein [Dyadobacter sp. CY343]|uniref:caspase family protein n=1 Tax=Dyadobacter sp. CY343 TaxID=2907299 RepID=UPI001F254C69|nr:caspase family protein [Dyadobacter sp. CY343]MCE7059229.1 caspase family protein [Dyadobacter sp. CY343]